MTMLQADRSFQERIARISSGKQFEAENVIGVKTLESYKKIRRRAERAGATTLVSQLREVMVMPVALGFGLLAVLLARATWFHLDAKDVLPASLAEFGMRGETGLAFLALAFFMIAFRLGRKMRIAGVTSGFTLMAFGEGAFAQSLPGLWAAIFSPEYTMKVIEGATLSSSFL